MKPNHDQPLINFLKQHEPLPPPAPTNAETALMALITTTDSSVSQPHSRLKVRAIWLIPTAIIAGMGVMWGRYQSHLQTPRIADYELQPPTLSFLQPVTNQTLTEELELYPEDFDIYLESAWSEPLFNTESSETYFGYEELMLAP